VANIVQQTLGFVRDSPSSAPLRVAAAMDDALQLLAHKLEAKKIKVTKRFRDHATIRGFAGELTQVFSNLVVNAIDAMPEGGCLSLHIARSHEWSGAHRGGVRVSIADDGSGIEPQHMVHIFEPFFTTKKDVGTGLGLWLSHNIVLKHGGSIRVRSSEHPGSSGTVFSIFLPDAAAAEPPLHRAAS